MAKKISMIPQSQSNSLTENALLDFIRHELNNYYKDCEPNIISKVRAAYPSLRDEQIRDIFQDVCIALVEKAHDGNLRLTCSLFHYVYRCCWRDFFNFFNYHRFCRFDCYVSCIPCFKEVRVFFFRLTSCWILCLMNQTKGSSYLTKYVRLLKIFQNLVIRFSMECIAPQRRGRKSSQKNLAIVMQL